MKTKGSLPKDFETMLKKLKRLDDELGISVSFFNKPTEKQIRKRAKEKERERLLDEIWQGWPRRTVSSKDVLQMRGNALRNLEVKNLLVKRHIRIEGCALIDLWGEEYIGKKWDCPAHCSPEDIKSALTNEKFGFQNSWQPRHRYEWGGPKDSIKILFRQSKNNRFKLIGLIEMFPEKKAA